MVMLGVASSGLKIVPLQSKLFRGDPKLEACLVEDAAHVLAGQSGEHVGKIHTSLMAIDGLSVAPPELRERRYGPSTVSAVLSFKTKRSIINPRYERTVDPIVGKMTIAALDKEMVAVEATSGRPLDPRTYDRRCS